MLTDIAQIMATYANDNDYYYLLEYPSGENQAVDRFLLSNQEYALYQNIIETAQFYGESDRYAYLQRTIEINLFKKSPTKDDKGENYYPILFDLQNRIIDIYKHFKQEVVGDIPTARIESGIDTNDATLCLVRLTITIQDEIQIC